MFHSVQFLKQLWTPAVLGLIGWYDPSDASTLTTSGSDITQLNDKSGNNSHLTAAVGEYPTTGDTQAGLTVCTCTAAQFMTTGGITLPSSGNLVTFGLMEITGITSTFDSIYSMNSSGNDFQFASNNATQFNGQIARNGTNVVCSNGPYAGPSIFCTRWDYTGDGTCAIWIDGTQDGSQGYATTLKLDASQTFHAFTNRVANSGPDGWFSEMITLEDCTTSCRQHIEGYLAHKWGTTGKLPQTHPYKNVPPKA